MKDLLLAVAPFRNAKISKASQTAVSDFIGELVSHIKAPRQIVSNMATGVAEQRRVGPYFVEADEIGNFSPREQASPTRLAARMAAMATLKPGAPEIYDLAPYALAALWNGGSIVAGQVKDGHDRQVNALIDQFALEAYGLKTNLRPALIGPRERRWVELLRRYGLTLPKAGDIVERAKDRSGLQGYDYVGYDRIFRSLMSTSEAAPNDFLIGRRGARAAGEARDVVREAKDNPLAPTSSGDAPFDIPSSDIPFLPPPPSASASPNSTPPSFFFKLEGDDARGAQVVWGKDFALVFNYGVLDEAGLAVLQGEQLSKIVKEKMTVNLGVDVMPVGLTLVEHAKGPAVFKEGVLTSEPLRFRLRAPEKEGAPPATHGVNVVFTVNGVMIYKFFLDIMLCEKLDDRPRATPVHNLDPKDIVAANVDLRRIARIYINMTGNGWQIYGTIDDVDFEPQQTSRVNPASLAQAYTDTIGDFRAIANDAIWRNLTGDFDGEPGDVETALNLMKRTAAAGSKLYRRLKADPVFQSLLTAIDALPEGSRITVISNETVFPWELLYPLEYVVDVPAQNFNPKLFWGRRFLFESLLLVSTASEKPPPTRRQPMSLQVGMGYNSGIDSEPPWNDGRRLLLPVKLQKDYFDGALQPYGRYFDQRNAIQVTLTTAYVASMIYFFCHGSANQLKFDKADSTFGPDDVLGDPYPGWPLIFLNACDTADISPLSFFSFRTNFGNKRAAGLIAPSYPVPTLFAALFGRAFLSEYAAGRPVGIILFDLRRRLVEKNNPLGLWYSLQCLLDVRAPEG